MSHSPDSPHIITLTSKRAKQAAANMHLIAGVGILFTGLSNFDVPDHTVLAIAEIAVGGLLLLGLVLERVLPHAHVGRYDWILDVLAGAVAFVEGFSKMHGHFRAIVGAYWLAALLFFIVAYFRPRLKKLRYARFEKQHIALKTHPFKSERRIKWPDIASLDVNTNILVTTKAGTRFKVDLNDQEEPAKVRERFLELMEQHGVRPTSASGSTEQAKKA